MQNVIDLAPKTVTDNLPVDAVDVAAALARIRPWVKHTPLMYSAALSVRTDSEIYLKLESRQLAGSFKPRISFNKLLSLNESQRRHGVIASTAGGHGMGLSLAANVLSVACDIYLPEAADPGKVEFMRAQNAQLTFFPSVETARVAAVTEAESSGKIFVSAYNDPAIIAGGGTIGLEILAEQPEIGLLVTGIGGGGVINGMAIAIKHQNPNLMVWGVMPENNPVLGRWLEAGKVVDVETQVSIADGLGADIETDSITIELARHYIDKVILVSEAEIIEAMAWCLAEHEMEIEPSGAAPIAALLRIPPPKGIRTAVVITGGNISTERFQKLVSEA
jgi:threonine dehydratase